MALELGQTRLPQAAKIWNNWSVTCKSLSDSCLTVFRVEKISTLKTPKVVIISELRVALKRIFSRLSLYFPPGGG